MPLPTISSGRLFALNAGSLEIGAETLNTNSINEICSFIEKKRKEGVTQNIIVNLKNERYTVDAGQFYNVAGVSFCGNGGSEIEFKATAPAQMTVPDLGFPATKTITSGCLGIGFRGDMSSTPKNFSFHGINFLGLTSTPSTSGDYYLIGATGCGLEFEHCMFSNEYSQTANLSAGVMSPYKALAARNVNSLALIYGGEDKQLQPDPRIARAVRNVRVVDCEFHGEPLAETSGSSGVLIGCYLRKASNYYWNNILFGDIYHPADRLIVDVVFTANPANNSVITILSNDSFSRKDVRRNYTIKTTPDTAGAVAEIEDMTNGANASLCTKSGGDSGSSITLTSLVTGVSNKPQVFEAKINTLPADNSDIVIDSLADAAHTFRFKAGGGTDTATLTHINTTTNSTVALATTALIAAVIAAGKAFTARVPSHVLIGASKEATMVNFIDAVNAKRIKYNGSFVSGSDYAEAVQPADYLGSGSVAACRIQSTHDGVGLQSQSNAPYSSFIPKSNFVGEGADPGGAITLRNICIGRRRTGHWKYGLRLEDCYRGYAGPTVLGFDSFVFSPYLNVATIGNLDFSTMETCEAGHNLIIGWQGENNQCANGFHNQNSGFWAARDCELGQFGSGAGGASSKVAMFKIENGTHAAKRIAFTKNPADGDIITIGNDGHDGTIAIEFESAGGVTPGNVGVTIASTLLGTLQNLRAAITTQFDAHVIKCFCSDPLPNAAAGFYVDLTFITWTARSASISVTETVDSGTAYAITDVSRPAQCYYADIDIVEHFNSTALSTSQPDVWAENVLGHLNIRGVSQHSTEADITLSAQAVMDVTINSVPTNNSDVILNSVAAGGPGTAVTFRFTTVDPTESATLKWVDTTGLTTAEQCAAALSTKIHAAAIDGTNPRSFDSKTIASLVRVADGAIGVNATLATKSGGDSGTSITIAAAAAGTANVADQGEHWPIVLKNVRNATIQVNANPLVLTNYNESGTIVEAYGNLILSDIAFGLSGIPKQLAYLYKDANTTSKVKFIGCDIEGGWGHGRNGRTQFFDLGGSMVDGDVIVTGCVANGVAVG